MHRESSQDSETTSLVRRAIHLFDLIASSGDKWLIAADWLEDSREGATSNIFRRGMYECSNLSNGNGDGNGYGDGNGDGNGYGEGNGNGYGNGNGNGNGYGDGEGNGNGNGYGEGNGNGYGDGYGNGEGNGN